MSKAFESHLTRRKLLRLMAIGTGGIALVACQPSAQPSAEPTKASGAAQPTSPAAQATSAPAAQATTAPGTTANSKKYAGATVRMLSQGGSAYEPSMEAFAKEFADKTGAKVEFDWAPWEGLMPKVQADIASGKPQYDIFLNDVEFQYTIWPNLLDINPLIKKTNYDMSDFFAACLKYGENIAGNTGKRFGLPFTVGTAMIFYRKDLVTGEFPKTWKEYEDLLAKLTTDKMKGLGFPGVTAQLVKHFLARYWYQGDPLLTKDWKPLINSDKGVKALTMEKDDMDKYAPKGMLAWDNPDAANAFLNGDVAVVESWPGFIAPMLDDSSKSKVVGKWAIAPFPEKGTGNFTQHNAVIFKGTKNPEAAFDFIALASDAEHQKRALLEYQVDPSRKGLYSDPDVAKKAPYRPQMVAPLEQAKPFLPGVPQWLEMFIALGEGASTAMSGKAAPKAALDEVAKKWNDLIKQNPLSFEYTE